MPRIRRHPLRLALDIAFGQRCAGCGMREGGELCAACRAAVARLRSAPAAMFEDEPPISTIVRRAKFGHWRGGGRVIAELVCEQWQRGAATRPQVDVVTWVPADARRRRRRGVHLPEQVARRLARELDALAMPLVERTGPSLPQRGLGRAGRRANVAGAFRFTGARWRARAVLGRRVLVVDDVRTTGATLDAVARCLRPHVRSVRVLAVTGVGNHARSADFLLTIGRPDADASGYDYRKVAPRLHTPRPP